MNCNNCKEELSKILCDLPSMWRTPIVEVLCKERNPAPNIDCNQFKKCETITSLSSFTQTGTSISISYLDERGTSTTRSFNFAELINNTLDGVDPKCLTTPTDWGNLSFAQRFQLLIDSHCSCCDTTVCPAPDDLAVYNLFNSFNLVWDNTNVVGDLNVISQRLSKRLKSVGGPYTTTGFVPASDQNKNVFSATFIGQTNRIYEFKLEAICSSGGPTEVSNGKVEQIKFECIAPLITVHSPTSVTISTNLTGTDINKVRYTIKLGSSNTIVAGPLDIANVADAASTTVNSLIGGTTYRVEVEYFSFVNGIEVISSGGNYLSAVCGGYSFTTHPAPTTTTTTTLPPTTTTTTTSTTSTTTTTTTMVCATIVDIEGDGYTNPPGTTTTTTTLVPPTTTTTSTTIAPITTTTTTTTVMPTTTTTTTEAPGIQAFIWFGDEDPYPGMSGFVDSLDWIPITLPAGSVDFSVNFPSEANNLSDGRYVGLKLPDTFPALHNWENGNSLYVRGEIPDIMFRDPVNDNLNFLGATRYMSRNPFFFDIDATQPLNIRLF